MEYFCLICCLLQVNLAWDEDIIEISGTFGVSSGAYAQETISSLSFVTNKRSHGPFGCARGTHFSVPWQKGSFAGFYGIASYYIDGIGIYLRAIKSIDNKSLIKVE